MQLKVFCIKGPSYIKQHEGYQLKLKNINVQIRDLANRAKRTCDPNLELSKQNKCKVAIANLSNIIMKKNELIKEFELFEEEWKEHSFDDNDEEISETT